MGKINKKHFMLVGVTLILAVFIVALFLTPKQGLTGEVISIVTPEYIELQWDNENVLTQKIGISSECITAPGEETNELVTECNWTYQDLDSSASSFKDYDIESTLKFYQIETRVKIGEGSCKPECITGQREGWYDSCTGQFLKADDCSSEIMEAYCCLIDSDSQGWYDAECDLLKGETSKHLIHYDGSCQIQALVCDRKSNVLVKFTQELVRTQTRTQDTSINWLAAAREIEIVPGNLLESATELLKTEVVDYVAYWNPGHQQYYGAAFGTPPQGIKLITGNFMLKQYNPYFVGAKENAKITWAGKLPARRTFEFKYVPEYLGEPTDSYNYLVLPFDTKIKMASDLCNPDVSGVPINQQENIVWWDPETQQYILSPRTCEMTLPNSSFDFELEPGKVYRIVVTKDAIWEQV